MDYRSAFALSEMSTARIDVSFPFGNYGTMKAGYSHLGDAEYAEHQVVAGYSMRLNPQIEAGVEVRYCVQAVSDGHYENRHWLSPTVMTRISFNPRIQSYAVVGTRPWDDDRPWRMHVGVAYRAVNRLLTLVELESEDRWRLRMGAEYGYRQHFFFRAGFATSPLVVTAGVGVSYGRYLFDVSVESHPVLGLTPQFSLAVCF